MDTPVNRQGTRDRKLAIASLFRALVRLLASVRSHVLRHDIGLRVALFANGALVRLVTYDVYV